MKNTDQQGPILGTSYSMEEKAFSLMDILLVFSRHLKIIILLPTIICTLTIIYVLFLTKPVYTSTAKIISGYTGGSMSQAAGFAAQFGIPIPSGQSEPKWAYPEIIQSRILARSMLNRKFDTDEFGFQKSLLQILTYGNDDSELSLDTLKILAVDNFLNMIDISEDITTSILTLNINASEPRLAAEVNQALIEELDAHQRKYNKNKTSDTKQFIQERIQDTEKELQAIEEALKDFRVRNRRIENSPTLQLEEQRLFREVTVLTGVFTTLKQQLETTKIEEVKESDYVVVLDPPEIPIRHSNPSKIQQVILAGILGIGLGVAIGLLMDYFENSNTEEKEKLNIAKSLFIKNFLELITLKSNK